MIKSATVTMLFLSLSLTASGQEIATEESIREFNVEVIVFAYTEDVSVGSEVFVPDDPPPLALDDDELADRSLGVDTFTDTQPQVAASTEAPELPEESPSDEQEVRDYRLLTEDQLQMQDIAGRLRRLDVYNVLLHAGWTQAAMPKDNSITMQLDMLAPAHPELSGQFTLYVSRFLHLVAELELDAPGSQSIPVVREEPQGLSFDEPASRVGPVRYRINEDRIFRSDETRYYDHPKFGVVARITRYEAPEQDTEESLPGSAIDTEDALN